MQHNCKYVERNNEQRASKPATEERVLVILIRRLYTHKTTNATNTTENIYNITNTTDKTHQQKRQNTCNITNKKDKIHTTYYIRHR